MHLTNRNREGKAKYHKDGYPAARAGFAECPLLFQAYSPM